MLRKIGLIMCIILIITLVYSCKGSKQDGFPVQIIEHKEELVEIKSKKLISWWVHGKIENKGSKPMYDVVVDLEVEKYEDRCDIGVINPQQKEYFEFSFYRPIDSKREYKLWIVGRALPDPNTRLIKGEVIVGTAGDPQ